MKPSNWNNMATYQRKLLAQELIATTRGEFILSQALVTALSAMKKTRKARREVSNMEDMEMLLELFPLYMVVAEANKAFKVLSKKKVL